MCKKSAERALDPRWGELSAFHDPYVLANFKPRNSDVLITTAPKAGTTWMQQILYQLKSGGDANFSNIFQVVPWLEFPSKYVTSQQKLKEYEAMSGPRLLKTHCTYLQTPGTCPPTAETNTARIVLTSRDPRDCCVSFYHHMMSMTVNAREYYGMQVPASFDVYFEEWMEFASWYNNVESWWPHINDKNVLWLRYEDMVDDLGNNIQRLLTFLQWKLTPEQLRCVTDHCSFTWMKAHSDKFILKLQNGEPEFKPGGFIRKGKVGDHKNLLTEKQEQCIIEEAHNRLPQECLQFLKLV